MTDLVEAVSAYADRFHRAIGDEHHVASPLGAWLVLALAAPATSGAERARLENVLGGDADWASARARELLGTPHAALRLAAAAWRPPSVETAALTDWLSTIAGVAQVGDLPTQAEADAWAGEMTGGLIDRFPVDITTDTLLVLASAIACTVSWRVPFEPVAVDELNLPPAASFAGLRRMLRDPGSAALQAIVGSDIGPLAVHAAASARNDLVVVSVLAEASVPAVDVLARAHPIATSIGRRSETARLSLFDLPLGVGHAWTITERAAPVEARDGREERYETLLPAWSAQSEHDLLASPELGFGIAGAGLAALVGPGVLEAKQAALARYTRTGFEAAAVTVLAVRASAMQRRDGLLRTARLEFGRPYAVVAVARGAGTAWAGLPVFSAWITAPDDVD